MMRKYALAGLLVLGACAGNDAVHVNGNVALQCTTFGDCLTRLERECPNGFYITAGEVRNMNAVSLQPGYALSTAIPAREVLAECGR